MNINQNTQSENSQGTNNTSAKSYLKIAGNIHLSYYIEAAEILGLQYEIVLKGLIAKISYNSNHTYIINTVVPLNAIPSGTIAKRKFLTSKILSDNGFPVPKQFQPKTEQEAVDIYMLYKDIVVKPAQGLGGHGVTVLPQNEEQVREAYSEALKYNKSKDVVKVLIEEFAQGDHFRILVLDDKVIGAVQRIPARVIGDGSSTIEQLINISNVDRAERGLKLIPFDIEMEKKLTNQGLKISSVPPKDEIVKLRFNANLTTGGSTKECLNNIHPYYLDLAIKAVKLIGLRFGGVDLIAQDITTPNMKCAINEINYNPGLRPHYKPDEGEIIRVAIPVMSAIKEMLENQK